MSSSSSLPQLELGVGDDDAPAGARARPRGDRCRGFAAAALRPACGRRAGTFRSNEMLMSCPVSSLVAGVKIGSGKLVALLQARRQRHAADGARLAILLPARAGQVAADDALDRHDLGLAHEHAAPGQLGAVHARRQVHVVDVGGEQMVGRPQVIEPEGAQRREHAALVGDAGRQHPVEGADAVGADQQQAATQIVDVAHLAASHGHAGKGGLQNGHVSSLVLGPWSVVSCQWSVVSCQLSVVSRRAACGSIRSCFLMRTEPNIQHRTRQSRSMLDVRSSPCHALTLSPVTSAGSSP